MNLGRLKTGFVVYHQRTGERLVFSSWRANPHAATGQRMAICVRPGVSGMTKIAYVPASQLDLKPLSCPPEPVTATW